MNLVIISIVVFVLGVLIGRIWGRWRWTPRPFMKTSVTDRMLLKRVQGENPFMSHIDSKNPELTMNEALLEIELIAKDSLKVGHESETIKSLRANARRLRGA